MPLHLSRDALIEMAEAEAAKGHTGRAETVHGHLAQCRRCREVFDQMRHGLALAREVDVPEPSPLFWDHFSARVREAVEEEGDQPDVRRWWLGSVRWRVVVAAGCIVLAMAGVALWQGASRSSAPVHPSAALRPARIGPASISTGDPAATMSDDLGEEPGDTAWSLVSDAASTTDFETALQAGGFALQPGAAERAAAQLSPDEQREVVRLLQAAVERPE